jgi:YHS domain-containing protein
MLTEVDRPGVHDQFGLTMGRMIDSLDDGRVSFGNRDEIELATATDPVCGKEMRRADAAGAIDHHGVVYFFCSVGCRDAFAADPGSYIENSTIGASSTEG